MTLIDTYVTEVGRRLPRRGRADIEAELRSTLEDMLEDRSRKAGRPADEAMMSDLLKEYGPPDKVAATYHSTQYLIGPRIYPFFIFVLRIVFAVLTITLSIGLGIRLGTDSLQGVELARALGNGVLGILGALLQAFGNIVLVFAILERVLPDSEFKTDEEKKAWDPASLKKTAERTEVKLWETIMTIVFTVAALIIFNGYPQLIGVYFLKNGAWTIVPFLSEAFFRWLPYLNILWVLQILLSLVLLRQGRFQALTRWFAIALDVAGIVVGYLLLTGPSIVAISPAALQATGLFNAGSANAVSMAAEQGVRAIIGIIVVLEGVDVVKEVIKQVRGKV